MTRELRVAHVVPASFGPNGVVGGAERYAFELARHMAAVVPTELITFGERSATEVVESLTVRTIGGAHYVRGQRTNPFSFHLARTLRNATVVHCHQQHVVASSLAAAYCRMTGRRVFVSDLGGGGWDISGYISTDCWFDGHLHISEYSKTVGGHANRPDANVILGGVDTSRFVPPADYAEGGPVLFVGRVLPHKGVDVLVSALPDSAKLEVLGRQTDPAYASHLREMAGGKRVTFIQDADDAGLLAAYQRASCVVLPSVYRDYRGQTSLVPELLGQTLLEGMACGLPAICTRVASLPEVVDDCVTGLIVEPNDVFGMRRAIESLLSKPSIAQEMGRAGRERVLNRFTWAAVVDRCLAAYRHPQ